jgi:hypothetical protein
MQDDEWDDVKSGWAIDYVYYIRDRTRYYVTPFSTNTDLSYDIDIVPSRRYKKNGRTFFYIKGRQEEQEPGDVFFQPTYNDVVAASYDCRKMFLLICSGFRMTDILVFVRNGTQDCSNLGSKIASSLIKIASTRIFAEPEQSILELPVNSIDSYNKVRGQLGSVGKFGMGFFSILYWLVGHPERYMVITSYYALKKEGEDTDVHYMFECKIQEVDNELTFCLKTGESNVTQTGTRMELNCKDDKFTAENVERFGKQLKKLSYTNTDLIAVRVDVTEEFQLWNRAPIDSRYKVYVQYNENGLFVEDFAQGLNLTTLLKTLFVPSVSTKTLKAGIELGNGGASALDVYRAFKQTQIRSEADNLFIILVRSVAVVYLPFSTNSTNKYHIVIELPSNTRIPVSRDDIIFTAETKTFFKAELQTVIAAMLEQRHIYTLEVALKAYTLFTSQTENRDFFVELQNWLKGLVQQENYIPVEYNYYKLLSMLNDPSHNRLVEAEMTDLIALEEFLREKGGYREDIYFMKKVFLTQLYGTAAQMTNAGLSQFLFVSKSYARYTPGWQGILLQVFDRDSLYLAANGLGSVEVTEVYDPVFEERYLSFWNRGGFRNVSQANFNTVFDLMRQIVCKLQKVLVRFELVLGTHFKLDAPNVNPISAIGTSLVNYQKKSSDEKYMIVYILNSLFEMLFMSFEKGILYVVQFSSMLNHLLGRSLPHTYDGRNQARLQFSFRYRVTGIEPESQYAFFENNPRLVNYVMDLAQFQLKLQWDDDRLFRLILYSYETFLTDYIRDYYKNSGIRNSILNRLLLKEYHTFLFFTCYVLISNIINRKNDDSTRFATIADESSGVDVFKFLSGFIDYTIPSLEEFISHFFEHQQVPEDVLNKFVTAVEVEAQLVSRGASFKLIDLDPQNVPSFTLSEPVEFTESQLINYVLTEDVKDDSFFKSVSESKNSNGTNVQITEIAINEGSTKSFIHATLTETLQNSLDAIREEGLVGPRAKIEAQLMHSPTHLVYQITDFVGIPFNGIVSMMIPFLSSKTPSELVTGEMGSGFFNLYRESDQVIIQTVKDGRKTLIVDMPIKDRFSRVVDLTRKVQLETNQTLENRTDIFVFIPKTGNLSATAYQVSSFVYFITNVFGLLNLKNVTFNGQNIYIPTIPFLETTDFSCRKVTNQRVESYLFTKEVPFSTLSKYLINMEIVPQYLYQVLEFNTVINIKHGLYTPVQTRAKINISSENAQKLSKFIKSVAYLNIIDILDQEPNLNNCDFYLRYFSSPFNLGQLISTVTTQKEDDELKYIEDFMLYYRLPENDDKSFQDLFVDSAAILEKKCYRTASQEQKDQIRSLTQNEKIHRVLVKWLQNKAPPPPPRELPSGTSSGQERKKKEVAGLEELHHILTVFVKTFWALGKQVQLFGQIDTVPTLILDDLSDMGANGFYLRSDHSITLDYSRFEERDILFFNEFFLRGTASEIEGPIVKNDVFNKLILNEKLTRTLVHELEHARRRQDCTQAAHGKTNRVFQSDDPNVKTYEYDAGANAAYIAILAAGLFRKMLEELRL